MIYSGPEYMKKMGLFPWFNGWSSSGYASTIGTLRGSTLVNVFDCGALFILVPSWFASWSFFWPTSLTGTLRGTARGFTFLNISARVFNSSLCSFPDCNKRLAGAGFYSEYIRSCAA